MRPALHFLAVTIAALIALPASAQQGGKVSVSAEKVGQAGETGQAVGRLGGPLVCPATPLSTLAAADALFTQRAIRPSGVHIALARTEMASSGFSAQAPKAQESLARAAQASWLLTRGYVVATKLINDASMGLPGYKPFGSAMEMHLTVLTQPVNHQEAPEDKAPGAQGSASKADHGHSHGSEDKDSGIEEASAALNEIIRRVSVTAKALGEDYKKPAVRMYILAHGFRDDFALPIATHGVCSLNLSPEVINKINVSARFMAMPGKPVPGGSTKPGAKR